MRIAAALLIVAAGCGGALAADDFAAPRAAATQCPQLDTGCDYCPGAASITTQLFGPGQPNDWPYNTSMTHCQCADPNPNNVGLDFSSCPPLGSCAHIACMFQHYCANGGAIIPPGTCPP